MESVQKKWSPEGRLDTPYQRARQEWDDRIGSARVQAKNWRLAALFGYGLNLLCIAGLIFLGAQPKVTPHIIEVDKIGAPHYRGAVGVSARSYTVSDASIKYHLRRFVTDTRSISSDTAVVKANWLDAYDLLTSNASNTLNTYAQQNNPIRRALEERVGVQIISMVPMSRDTWQVDWRESQWDTKGNQVAEVLWRGMFRIVLRLPEKEEELVKNPIGFYIDEFHWTRVQS